MSKTITQKTPFKEPKTTPLYQQMKQVQSDLANRVNELEFAVFVLTAEKSDWEEMSSELNYKIHRRDFTSERSEVDNLALTIKNTIESHTERLKPLNDFLSEGKNRLRKINSAIASIDITDNIEAAVKGGTNINLITSRAALEAETEVREIKTLLHSTRALVELRQKK